MERQQVSEGATVRSLDGEKLGKVIACGDDSFIIEKGLFFKREYSARYDDVRDIRDGEIYLSRNKDDLYEREDWQSAEGGTGESRDVESREEVYVTEVRDLGAPQKSAPAPEQTMPLVEEELKATKTYEKAGEVRIHKDVVTEEKTITVPVSHEKVRVEEVPASGGAAPGPETFKETTTTIPVYEEKVEVTKEPVVREEIRVSKEGEVLHEERTETVRKEVADIEKEGRLKETTKPIEPEEKRP